MARGVRARLLIGMHGSGHQLGLYAGGLEVLEIDLRHQWTCDPLCDAHRSGLLAPEAYSTVPRCHKAITTTFAGFTAGLIKRCLR